MQERINVSFQKNELIYQYPSKTLFTRKNKTETWVQIDCLVRDPRKQQTDETDGGITAMGNWTDPAKDCEEPYAMYLKIVHQKEGRLETPTPLDEGCINSLALSC